MGTLIQIANGHYCYEIELPPGGDHLFLTAGLLNIWVEWFGFDSSGQSVAGLDRTYVDKYPQYDVETHHPFGRQNETGFLVLHTFFLSVQ